MEHELEFCLHLLFRIYLLFLLLSIAVDTCVAALLDCLGSQLQRIVRRASLSHAHQLVVRQQAHGGRSGWTVGAERGRRKEKETSRNTNVETTTPRHDDDDKEVGKEIGKTKREKKKKK